MRPPLRGSPVCGAVSVLADTAAPPAYPLSLHDALPISGAAGVPARGAAGGHLGDLPAQLGHPGADPAPVRSEEHTSELQSRGHLVCRLLLEKKTRLEECAGPRR